MDSPPKELSDEPFMSGPGVESLTPTLYPSMEHIGGGVFRLPGRKRSIFITPRENDCTLDGVRKRFIVKWLVLKVFDHL